MSSSVGSAPPRQTRSGSRLRGVVGVAVLVVLLLAMGLSTKVVRIGSQVAAQPNAFNPAAYGAQEFPKVQADIVKRAVDAATLAAAIAKDPTAAGTKYGVQGEIGPEFPVKFTGVAGASTYGVYYVDVPGLSGTTIRVQTGPAINGTDVRDATGIISFGQFTNQIDYQNAGSALNDEIKKHVLDKVDTAHLKGKTISVVGVFQLVVPTSWLITPVKLDVK